MRIHPACALFPDMPKSDYDELVADIKANGCHVPIVLYNGAILDGRHRWKACAELKIDCPKVNWKPKKDGSLTAYVLSMNLHRRHLSVSQLGTIGADAIPLFAKEAAERQKTGKVASADAKGKAAGHAAKTVGVSQASVERSIALKKKDPKAFEKVKKGEQTLAQAKKSSGSSPAKKSTGPPARKTKFEQAVAAKDPLLRIAGFVVQIRKLVKQIESKPIGAHFHAQQAITDLKNLERNAKFALPFKECPICGGKRGCKLCEKAGCVPKDVYERWEASQK